MPKLMEPEPRSLRHKIPKGSKMYQFGPTLGSGAFGKIKLGVHQLSNELVAMKIFEKANIGSRGVKMLHREINSMSMMHHPNVLQLYEVIETKKEVILILELAPQGNLEDFIEVNGRLPEPQAKLIFRQIVLGLQYVHNRNTCHRDIKAANILLGFDNDSISAKLSDFGLSNIFRSMKPLSTFCGSPTHAAPELILRQKYSASKADLWSLGIVLYNMVVGYLPFHGDTFQILYERILTCTYELPDYLSPGVKELISKLLVIDPSDRLNADQVLDHSWLHLPKTTPLANARTCSSSLHRLSSKDLGTQSVLPPISDSLITKTYSLPEKEPVRTFSFNKEVLHEMQSLGYNPIQVKNSILYTTHCPEMASYSLLEKKQSRLASANAASDKALQQITTDCSSWNMVLTRLSLQAPSFTARGKSASSESLPGQLQPSQSEILTPHSVNKRRSFSVRRSISSFFRRSKEMEESTAKTDSASSYPLKSKRNSSSSVVRHIHLPTMLPTWNVFLCPAANLSLLQFRNCLLQAYNETGVEVISTAKSNHYAALLSAEDDLYGVCEIVRFFNNSYPQGTVGLMHTCLRGDISKYEYFAIPLISNLRNVVLDYINS